MGSRARTIVSLLLAFLLARAAEPIAGAGGGSTYLTEDERWMDQRLDHFSPTDHRQFKQRYFEFLDYHRAPGGPVFLSICGDSACDGIFNDYLAVLAKKFDAAVVSLEHRYYGKSSPFKQLTTENLRFLSSQQALFDLAVFRQYYQIGESAGPECEAALQEITQLVDAQLRLDSHSVKALFGAQTLENDGDFLSFLADAAAAVEAYAQFVKDYYIKKMATQPSLYDQEYLKETTPDDSSSRLWWFQKCSEVAGFQMAPKNDSVRSARINTRYYLDLCRNVFGEGVYPDVFTTNLYYGGTRLAASKIVFTNGSQDPFRHASKQKSSKDMPSYLIKCRNCGHGTDLAGCPQWPFRVQGDSSNCSSPAAVNTAREKIAKHIDLWLSQCNKPSVGAW